MIIHILEIMKNDKVFYLFITDFNRYVVTENRDELIETLILLSEFKYKTLDMVIAPTTYLINNEGIVVIL